MEHPRRPVYLEVPTDLLSAAAAVSEPGITPEPARTPDVTALVEALAAAQRPLIWAGGGATASGAGQQVAALALALGAPVLTSYGGRGLLPTDHPCVVTLPPHTAEAGMLWDQADCVLVLGSDLDFMNTQGFRQPRPPVLLAVDLAELANVEPDVQVRGDVRAVLEAVLAAPPVGRTPWWSSQTVHGDGWAQLSARHPEELAFLAALESGLPDDVVVVADMCVAGYWYGGFGRVGLPRGLAYPVGWGTLGFGFPAALGTSLSGRPTVAVVGDGGFLFACGDLATAAQERLPVTVVLVDDGGYGMLRYDFTVHDETPVGTELEPPDFVALARAFRVDAVEVDVAGLGAAVTAGIASGRANLVVVKLLLAPPPNTSPNWYRARV
ncbi:MAG: thiamine pyrophosphate-binding protein [Frankiales bacterium]|nr:thiamine pyrophosphate-binding protein [Frankiales bacterium]